MNRFYVFIGKHVIEVWGILIALIVLLQGVYLSWTVNPVWLNRAGSLITIVGILLTALKFPEWFEKRLLAHFESSQLMTDDYLKELAGDKGKELTENHLSQIRSLMRVELKKMTKKIKLAQISRLKVFELFLILAGTFLNGFGDYIITSIKALNLNYP